MRVSRVLRGKGEGVDVSWRHVCSINTQSILHSITVFD